MAIDEDLAWLVRWAEVVRKIKDGAEATEPIELSPGECRTLARGLRGLTGVVEDQG